MLPTKFCLFSAIFWRDIPDGRDVVNVASLVLEKARENPTEVAIHHPVGRRGDRVLYGAATNGDLDQESDAIARGLEAVGVTRGMRTAVMVPPDRNFFALMLGLMKMGAVPVVVDPGIGLRRLGRCLSEAEPEVLIGIPRARIASRLLGWGRHTLRFHVTVGRALRPGDTTLAEVCRRGISEDVYRMAPTADDELAAILFTSGSTGPPKGVLYTHGNFAAQVEAIRELAGHPRGEVDLPTFPPFALFDPALGMTAVVPDMDPTRPGDVDPQRIFSAAEEFSATNLFGSPALLDTVGRYGVARRMHFSTLRRVVSAGAPVSAAIMERFLRVLPKGARILTPYGATECLPVSCIDSDEVLGETAAMAEKGAGICVGRPVPSVEVRIIAVSEQDFPEHDSERELPAGEIGEIIVCGPQVTQGYDHREAETRAAKMHDASGRLWHRMGDVGYQDLDGRLWYCGRKADRVPTANGPLDSIPCEAVFDTHPRVRRTALVGVPEGKAQRPVLCVELEADVRRQEKEAIVQELLALGATTAPTRAVEEILFHRKFPVDIRHNAKIGRPELARWAARRMGWRRRFSPGSRT